ncbi:MAG TPA: hypothetical protein VG498_17670 [Terriglobales bacterium]|nr:hypothetical protein [Terriglobales bacterium]
MMPTNRSSALLALLICLGFSASAQTTPPANYDEAKVGSYKLPEALVFKDGKRVRNTRDWERRRGELLDLFAENVYGRSPKAKPTEFTILDEDKNALGGKAVRKQVTVYFSAEKSGPREDVLIYIPARAEKPVPLILSLNFSGNHAVVRDPGVKLGTVWSRTTHQPEPASEASRGQDKGFEVEKVLDRGYGLATIYYQDIEPDFDGGLRHGIRPLFFKRGQTQPAPDDWGAIGAWAYGLSRAMDYVEKDRDIDAKRVAIMGHSRLGKTVLWAGAQDTRFAMVLTSCPGEGGASLARRNYGETIRNLTDRFPYWFAQNLKKYADEVDQLPVDMHELITLIAPRPVYVTGAEDDQWADPKGEFLALVAAGPVYKMLGGQDLGTDRMPAMDQPIQHTLAFHIRHGKHEVTDFDWDQFLSFADAHLR